MTSRKSGSIVGLRHPFGPHHDVAAARGRGETHRRRGDFPRRRHQLDPFEFLAAVFGLGVFLPVVVAANEILRLLDLDLLLLVGPPLDQQPLGLLRPVGREVAGVGIDRAVEKLERAVGDAVEEVAVVAHHDHRRRAFDQEPFEPLGGVDVEVVARLVEDHYVGLGQQQLGQHQAVLLAAAERSDRLVERLAAEAQAVENLCDAMVEIVGVLAVQLVLEMIVAVRTAASARPGRSSRRFRGPLPPPRAATRADRPARCGLHRAGFGRARNRAAAPGSRGGRSDGVGTSRRRRRPCRPEYAAAWSFRCRWARPARRARRGAARS